MAKDAILFRPRTKDTASGVTRKTLRRLAKLLDVPESEVIHKALANYARENLPRYELDDGPLTSDEHQDVRTQVQRQHGKAKVVEALFEQAERKSTARAPAVRASSHTR
jgi:hypothetical protein